AELAEEPPRLQFQVPGERSRLQGRLFDPQAQFAGYRVGRPVDHRVGLGKRVHRCGYVQLHRTLIYIIPAGPAAVRLRRFAAAITEDRLTHDPDGGIEYARE